MDQKITKFKNALISVSNKKGLVEFAGPLVEQGMRVVSTGGTSKLLSENNVDVVQVGEQTGFPEVMNGRVRTLHPNIHMALLARDHVEEDLKLLSQHDLEPFDLVVGNLYPFEEALTKDLSARDLAEFIDIGGPCLLRAAAKNFERITVICDPEDYKWVLEKGELTLEDRRYLASKVFAHVSSYDAMIATELSQGAITEFSLGGSFVDELRYGENPEQSAVWFRRRGARGGIHQAEILQGKALSYNNLQDLEAAVACLRDFTGKPATVAVKHANPCGVAIGENGQDSLEKALQADPVSVFGGIVATNQVINAGMAEKLGALFLECIVATEITSEAKEVFSKKKNLRVLEWKGMLENGDQFSVKTISGGYLVQTNDQVSGWTQDWKVIGEEPDENLKKEIEFAWRVCAHLKSNAISVSGGGATLGLGMGQVNRVDAVDQAIHRMKNHHADFKGESILASDAFFPFPDSIELIAKAGIRWVVQPGGSIKDSEVFEKAKDLGVNLIITGQRHFKH